MALAATRDVLAARGKWRYRGDERPPFAPAAQAGQESVWDYPRPPRIVADHRRVRVVAAAGHVVAASNRALRVLETASPPTFYVPAADVDLDCMHATRGTTHCEWKGVARAYDVAGVGDAAWTYAEDLPRVHVARRALRVLSGRTPLHGGWRSRHTTAGRLLRRLGDRGDRGTVQGWRSEHGLVVSQPPKAEPSWNTGRYIATIRPPTSTPSTPMVIGSISVVS